MNFVIKGFTNSDPSPHSIKPNCLLCCKENSNPHFIKTPAPVMHLMVGADVKLLNEFDDLSLMVDNYL